MFSRKNLQQFKALAIPTIFPIFLVAIWELAVRFGWWPRTLIAAPSQVLQDFLTLTLSAQLLEHSLISLGRLLGGFLLGSTLGVLAGSLVGLSKLFERLLAPTMQFLAPVPPVAWIPLLIILLGIGESSKIALITIGVFFVIFVNTFQGIRGADQKLVEVAQVYEKKFGELLLYVLFPSALPSILTGMRVALGLAWILLIAAEVIASEKGLGWLIWDARNFSRPDDMIVGMVTVGILGKLSDSLMARLETSLLQWRQAFKGV